MIIQDRSEAIKVELYKHAYVLGTFVAIFWVLELIDLIVLGSRLDMFGIRPRTLAGLPNIFLSPFLHAGIGHLISNTFPFLILGWFVIMRGTRDFVIVSLVTALISGMGVWLLGSSNSIHIGVSGIVFGYLGYLLMRGYFERSLQAIGLALIAVILYGGMVWGILPVREGVSWLGHLFGLIGGGVAAYLLSDHTYSQRTTRLSSIER